MKTSLILFLSFAFVSGQNKEVPKSNVSVATQIVNGRDAKKGERPFQVSLQLENGFHFCGGSVANKNWVVSAAHCTVNKKAEDVRVLAGTIDRRDRNLRRQAVQIINHENYNASDYHINDICVIKVDKPFEYSNNLKPAKLPEADFKTKGGQKAIVSGWGRTTIAAGVGPYILQVVDVFIMDKEECLEAVKSPWYHNWLYPEQVCASNLNQGKGFCFGDSGGPLTVDGTLVGIVSFFIPEDECARKHPQVYARVSWYIDWMNRYIQ